MSAETFTQALGKLVTDAQYRNAVETDPRQLISDYPLSSDEIDVLMQVWEKTGRAGDVVGHWFDDGCCCCCCVF
jgi:hypothetical protein